MGRNKRRQQHTLPSNHTAFRCAERFYKQRAGPIDLTNAIDFHDISSNSDANQRRLVHFTAECTQELRDLLGDCNADRRLSVYQISDIPGITIIRNPFSADVAKQLIHAALLEYTRKPNISNLDLHWQIPECGLVACWKKERTCGSSGVEKLMISRRLVNTGESSAAPTVGYSQDGDDDDVAGKKENVPSNSDNTILPSQLVSKLRWITIGRQYNWFTKLYESTEFPFPADLARLSKGILRAVGHLVPICRGAKGAGADMEDDRPEEYQRRRQEHCGGQLISCSQDSEPTEPTVGFHEEYFPEAGIVNFYQLRDTLTGHVDRSEINLEAPLVSLSFGHACVFLIGGANRTVEPAALIIRSGDVLILSGPARRAFHGVPRVLEGTLPNELRNYKHGSDECTLCSDFIRTARINMNVRQIFFKP